MYDLFWTDYPEKKQLMKQQMDSVSFLLDYISSFFQDIFKKMSFVLLSPLK